KPSQKSKTSSGQTFARQRLSRSNRPHRLRLPGFFRRLGFNARLDQIPDPETPHGVAGATLWASLHWLAPVKRIANAMSRPLVQPCDPANQASGVIHQ